MIPRGLVILGCAALSWAVVIGIGYAGKIAIETVTGPSVSEAYMQANRDLYFPTFENRCHPTINVCDLTGPGGHNIVWHLWLLEMALRGYNFRVVGYCASACETEYEKALAYHYRVIVTPGATLVSHIVTH